MNFIYSWRWFGPNDRIQLHQIRQAGATHVVTALHQIPVGEIWPVNAILERKNIIENAGLKWAVTESLPVSEDIKKKSGNYAQHIENYKTTIKNLAQCGITTICYNFMPILDWSRTDLKLNLEDGSYTSAFELYKFAAFDMFILHREEAKNDYSREVINHAQAFFNNLSQDEIQKLKDTILYGLPGSMETYSLDAFREMLSSYSQIDRIKLKEHLRYFLNAVVPVAESVDVKMAIHPDDPPWNLLGLPRIVSKVSDLKEIVEMISSPSNGITLCTGSLGTGYFNDLPKITKELASHIHFVHLRNVIRDDTLNFKEDTLFEGEIDVPEVVKTLISEGKNKQKLGVDWQLPIRPDHGHQMLDDLGKNNYPGYSLYGRMKNLAEIKGLIIGLTNSNLD